MTMNHEQTPHLWQRPIAWLLDLLADPDYYMSETQSAVLAMIWGAWLLNPLVNTFAQSFAYHYMAVVAPEHVWGALLLALGVMQFIGVMRWILRWRLAGLMLLSCMWFFQALLLYAGHARVLPIVFSVFSASTAWAFWRLSIRNR